jgi:hypothetical protein
MPLHKPDGVPKIPKSRKKSIESLKNTTPTKKEGEPEYSVFVYFKYDKLQKKQFYVVSIETVKEFSSLNYEISVDVNKTKDTIDISLRGLNTRMSYIVKPQPAHTDLFFEELFGKYSINIIKQDGSINTGLFEFNIFKKEITLLREIVVKKKNNRKFCSFTTEPNLHSFKED